MTSIESILKDNGPMLSSELIELLSQRDSASNEAIRKRLSRVAFPVRKQKGFFSANQSFFYLDNDFDSEIYFESLTQAMKKAAKRYFAILNALDQHKGYINKEQLAAYSFSPVENLKGHKRIDAIIKELLRLNMIREEFDCYSLNLSLGLKTIDNYKYSKAIEIAKSWLLFQFENWAKRIGLISYNAGKFYNVFGKFMWCFTAPSYIATLTQYRNAKKIPAFVVADVLIGSKITADDINYFIQKVDILSSQKNSVRILPFLLCDSTTEEALKIFKDKGIIVGFVSVLFGKEYNELIRGLIETIANAGAILKDNPEKFVDLLLKINKLVEGKTLNLRGHLFELAVGFYHSRSCSIIEIGKRIMGLDVEIDVYAVYPNFIHVVECKGYKNPLRREVVRKWLKETVPMIRKWLLTQDVSTNKEIVFEIWSTGGFDPEAQFLLERSSQLIKKYSIRYFGRNEILAKSQEVNNPRFIEILKESFFKDL